MKKIIILFGLVLLVSCKSKQIAVAEQGASEKIEASKIIQGHYSNKFNFETNIIIPTRYIELFNSITPLDSKLHKLASVSLPRSLNYKKKRGRINN